MEGIKISCVLCVLAVFFDKTAASYKRWLPDTNFDNPQNWNLKRTPCGNDVAIIPEESPIVYVQLNTTIKELVLPKNGELILGQNMGIGFTENPVASCEDVGGDLEFTAVHPEPWLNPDNWCLAPTERGACDLTQQILETEKVPCNYDDVIFPRDHSYFVDLSEDTPILSTKTVKISGASFTTTNSFTNFLNSPEGQRMFRVSSGTAKGDRINITRRGCENPRGCPCGNDKPEIAKAICTHVENRCSRPRCSKTIQPVGACCRLCGAVFNITRGYGFNFNTFTTFLKKNFLNDQVAQNEVNMTSSLTSNGWVQVVLNDVTGDKSASLAKRILADFNNDLASGGHKYAIDAVQLSLVTDTSEPSAHSGEAMSGGSIAGIVLGFIVVTVIIIVIVVIFIFRRTGRKIPVPKLPRFHLPGVPTMPGFSRRTPRATARVLPGVFSQPHTAPHIDPGFANPLYDTSPFDDANAVMKEMELKVASIEEQPTFDVSDRGFSNPLFGTPGPSMFRDPAHVEEPGLEDTSDKKRGTASRAGATAITIDNPSSADGDSTI